LELLVTAAFSVSVCFHTCADAATRTWFSFRTARRAGPPCGRSGERAAAKPPPAAFGFAECGAPRKLRQSRNERADAQARCWLHAVKPTNGAVSPRRSHSALKAQNGARLRIRRFRKPRRKRNLHYPRNAAFCKVGNKRSN